MPPMAGWPKPPIGGLKFIVITPESWITRKATDVTTLSASEGLCCIRLLQLKKCQIKCFRLCNFHRPKLRGICSVTAEVILQLNTNKIICSGLRHQSMLNTMRMCLGTPWSLEGS